MGGCKCRPFLFSTLPVRHPLAALDARPARRVERFSTCVPHVLSNVNWTVPLVNTTQQRIADRVRALTEEVITGTTYFLVDVAVRGHKGTRVVEVYVDSKEEFGHDDLAVISKEVGFLLDVEDVVDGSYKLEVSSPGIKRPLTMPQQYEKNVGRTLRVRYESEGNEEIVVGDLTSADEKEVELELASGERLRLPYHAITQARIELPW
jgi:ribosome maturation factor RimP